MRYSTGEWKLVCLTLVMALVVSCAALVPHKPEPKSPDQVLAVAEAALTGVFNGIAALVEQERITKSEFESMYFRALDVEGKLRDLRLAMQSGKDILDSMSDPNEMLVVLQNELLKWMASEVRVHGKESWE